MAHSNRRRRDYHTNFAKSRQSLPTSTVQLFDKFAQPLKLSIPPARHLYSVPPLDYFPKNRVNLNRSKLNLVGGTQQNGNQRQNSFRSQTSSNPDRFRSLRSFPAQKEAVQVFRDQHPRKMTLCETRKERTEVLHALGHTGKGGQKSPIWTRKSRIKC